MYFKNFEQIQRSTSTKIDYGNKLPQIFVWKSGHYWGYGHIAKKTSKIWSSNYKTKSAKTFNRKI